MLNAFIDTCVWLDLAQDRKLTPLLLVIENMVREGQLRLLVPKLVHDEFKRNRTRVAQASARSLKGHFQQVREALTRMPGSTRGRKALMKKLEDANHKIPIFGGEAEGVLERIDKLAEFADVPRQKLIVGMLDAGVDYLESTKKVGILHLALLFRDLGEYLKKHADKMKKTEIKGLNIPT